MEHSSLTVHHTLADVLNDSSTLNWLFVEHFWHDCGSPHTILSMTLEWDTWMLEHYLWCSKIPLSRALFLVSGQDKCSPHFMKTFYTQGLICKDSHIHSLLSGTFPRHFTKCYTCHIKLLEGGRVIFTSESSPSPSDPLATIGLKLLNFPSLFSQTAVDQNVPFLAFPFFGLKNGPKVKIFLPLQSPHPTL